MGKKKKTLIGYSYYIGMHMIISHPVDAVLRIDVGEKPIFYGNVTNNQGIIVYWPELFGGQQKEGGVAGLFSILFGGDTQPQDAYLLKNLGPDVPAFRGVMSVILNQMYLASMSPYIKPWQFLVKRLPGRSWYPAKADINDGSANAAHIIYDCFTNPSWGLGYPSSVLDLPSFTACADALYAEGLGLSFILSNTDTIESFMQQVCKHVAATLYTDPVTGKFVMSLLRNDYIVDNLRLYNESNIIQLQSYEKPSPAEMVNEVVVKFRPRGLATDDSVTAQDLASIQSQQGIISTTIEFTGIDNATNAGRVAARELRTRATPLTRVKFKANRSAWQEKIGGCIRFSWTAHKVANMVLRIVNINFGDLSSGEISITAVEDVFGLPYAQYLQPQTSQWVDPVQPPSVIPNRSYKESTYWDMRRNLSDAEYNALPTGAGFGIGAAGAPAQATPNFELWTKPSGGSFAYADAGAYAPTALTTAPATRTQTTIATGSFRGIASTIPAGTYALWGNELIRFDAYNDTTGVVTMGRGVLDTVPEEHASGTLIMFLENFQVADETIYTSGMSSSARMLMRTGSALMPIASVPDDNLTYVARAAKPYPPAYYSLQGGAPWPTTQNTVYGALSAAWRGRDRTQQLATLVDQSAATIGPETGITYTIRTTDMSTSTVLDTTTGLTGSAYDYGTNIERKFTAGNIKVEMWTVRTADGATSFQNQVYTIERHGLGFNLGSELGGTL